MKVGPFQFSRTSRQQSVSGAREPYGADDFTERGSTAGGQYTSILMRDYNPDLAGQQAYDTYDKMRRSDGQVRGVLRLLKTPIISAQWYVEPASDSPQDREIAAFVEWNLHAMSRSWLQILSEILAMYDFGWYAFEKVYELATWRRPGSTRGAPQQVVKWRKLAPRHPKTLDHWDFDSNGGIKAAHFQRYDDSGAGTVVPIPIEKLLLFTLDEEAGNPEGLSILRSMYPHWYYKTNLYKIDAIQKERHGIGVPEIETPAGAKPADKRAAREYGKNLRTNEQSFIVKPAGWKIGFAELPGNLVEPLKSAEHHDLLIARAGLTQFMNLGSGESGSRAVGGDMVQMFFRAQRYVADLIASIFNQYCVPQLVDYNYTVDAYPKLRVRKIGENADLRALSVALRNFVEVGAVTPDGDLEKQIRDSADLPLPSSEALGRTAEQRMTKPGDVSNRVPKPADGG